MLAVPDPNCIERRLAAELLGYPIGQRWWPKRSEGPPEFEYFVWKVIDVLVVEGGAIILCVMNYKGQSGKIDPYDQGYRDSWSHD
jgi:hypothetical protein